MATCPEIDDEQAPRGRLSWLMYWGGSGALGERDDAPQDEEDAPRQTLLHAFSTPIGGILLVGGLVMVVLPGPSLPLLLGGLVLLSREYDWARRLLARVTRRMPVGWRRRFVVPAVDARRLDAS